MGCPALVAPDLDARALAAQRMGSLAVASSRSRARVIAGTWISLGRNSGSGTRPCDRLHRVGDAGVEGRGELGFARKWYRLEAALRLKHHAIEGHRPESGDAGRSRPEHPLHGRVGVGTEGTQTDRDVGTAESCAKPTSGAGAPSADRRGPS